MINALKPNCFKIEVSYKLRQNEHLLQVYLGEQKWDFEELQKVIWEGVSIL